MRRLLLAVAATALVAFLAVARPAPASACSCVGITTREAAERADAVFLGTVTSAEEGRVGGERATTLRFEVSRVYKGTVYADQVVVTPADSAGCGLTPDVGTRWVIFANDAIHGDGSGARLRLTTTLCDGNLNADRPPRDLGRATAPLPGPSDRTERAEDTDDRLTRSLVVGGVGVVGLAALIGIGLAYLWRPQKT